MKRHRHPCWIAGGIAVCYLLTASPVWAQQIASDGTLSTSVISPDGRNFTITEGNRALGNLFHSFSQFSIPTGGSAFFDNALDVQNIIGRVTGGEVSNIDGLLRANGSANLFLLNPSGIFFGPNATLNIGGSFLASTASSLKFADGREFSTTAVSEPPLLTVSVPVGLQYGGKTAGITVQQSTLAVQPERTLALVGGDVTLSGGNLTASSGRVELGAVAGAGTVELTVADRQLQLRFLDGIARGDVSLTSNALVDASGSGGGDIQLAGRRITLSDSRVEATTQEVKGGDLTVTAEESVELIGNAADWQFSSGLFAETVGAGAAGDLSITTGKLVIRGSARVSAATRSAGDGGNLTVNAADSVELTGFNSNNLQLFTGLLTDTESTGAAGNLTIETKRLIVRDGAQISAGTLGAGRGGNLTVNAQESVELTGVSLSEEVASGLSTSVYPQATGNAGNLTVNTGRLIVKDGAQIFAGTLGVGNGGNLTVNASEFVEATGVTPIYKIPSGLISAASDGYISEIGLSAGRAGDLTINTKRLIVRDGGQVTTEVYGIGGQGGNLTVNATESVEVIGTPSNNYLIGSSGLRSNIPAGSSNSGNVTVNTGRLTVRDTGEVRVSNQGSGNAGNIIVKARSLLLDNQGSLTAQTASGEGGNIQLQVNDLLQMRRNSEIIAQSGGTGNGGNITINTDLLVALEDSHINANADQGRGGNIQLTVLGLFLSPTSRITASSERGVDGVVDIQTPDVDPNSGLVTLPEEVVDVTGLVAQSCAGSEKLASSEFIVTGRGGLPSNPGGTISSETVLADLGPAAVQNRRNVSGNAISTKPTSRSSAQIVEAQGWVVNPNGQVILTANAPLVTPHSPMLPATACNGG